MVGFLVYWFGLREGCGTSGSIACPAAELEEGVSTSSTFIDGNGLKFKSHGIAVVVPPMEMGPAPMVRIKATAMHVMGYALPNGAMVQ